MTSGAPEHSTRTDDVAPPGWYKDPYDPDRVRYWDGEDWANQVQVVRQEPAPTGWSPDIYLGLGALAAIVAGFAIGSGATMDDPTASTVLGAIFGFVASMWFGIGIVAKGVQVGRRYR